MALAQAAALHAEPAPAIAAVGAQGKGTLGGDRPCKSFLRQSRQQQPLSGRKELGRQGREGRLSPGQHSHACVVGLKAHKHVPATLLLYVLHQTVTPHVLEKSSHALHHIPAGTAKRASPGEPWLWAWGRDLAAGMEHLMVFPANMPST